MIITSFLFFLTVFVLIGIASIRYKQPTTEDYLLAGRSVKPWLVGLSFFATENSGFMFIGYIGMVYMQGVSAVWFVIGWYLGEVLVLLRTARKIREHSAAVGIETYSQLLSCWGGKEFRVIRRLSALIIMIFLGVYGAAQLSAGGKALNVLMGWPYALGALIGFVIVVIYCFAGGIRASIWTDAAQAFVMLLSLIILVSAGLLHVGGCQSLLLQLSEIDPGLIQVYPQNLKWGFLPYFLGWFFAGSGVLGQAHVMVRFMVIDKPQNVKRALWYYLGMVTVLSMLCIAVGLLARILLPQLALAGADPELSLPMLADLLLPAALTGLVLAGLFAAAISTADSQLLSSSAALTRDLLPRFQNKYAWSKIGTILVACAALLIAVSGFNNVFSLVTFAWAVMAAGFAPLLFLCVLGKIPDQETAVWMVFSGILASVLWKFAGYSEYIYHVLPGIAAGFLAWALLSRIRP